MPYTTEMIQIHQMADAMIDMLTYAQWARIRFAAERGGFEAGLRAMARVSKQMAAEKSAAAQEIAFLQGRIMGLQMMTDTVPSAAAPVQNVAAPCSITRRGVTSSAVKSIGYDAETQTLEVEWHHGGDVWRYADVSLSTYRDLMDSSSLGRYIVGKIKPFHTATGPLNR